MSSKIVWDEHDYPTEESLEELANTLSSKDHNVAFQAFYSALSENKYDGFYGPTKKEVRGEVIDVWEYHTGGWSGNEDIISTLRRSYLWGLFLERYDNGGHYYFKLPREFE